MQLCIVTSLRGSFVQSAFPGCALFQVLEAPLHCHEYQRAALPALPKLLTVLYALSRMDDHQGCVDAAAHVCYDPATMKKAMHASKVVAL